MALSGKFSYTNTTDVGAAGKLTPVNVMPVHDYALIEDEPERVIVQNTLGDIDQQERLVFQRSSVNNVPISFANSNPDPNAANIQYGIKLESLYRITSSTDDTFVKDLPITCTLTFKHPTNSLITADVITTILLRTLGALEGDDGTVALLTARLNELMRGSLKPTQ